MTRHFTHIILLTLFLVSCKQDNKAYDFDKIEIVEYYWDYSKQIHGDHLLRGTFFATIDNNRECKIIYNSKGISLYKVFQIPDSVLTELTYSFSKVPKDTSMLPPIDKPIMYEGPEIRFIYSSKYVTKRVTFLDDSEFSEPNCRKFYKFIKSNEFSFKTFTDTSEIKNIRMKHLESIYDDWYQFIKTNIDSIIVKPINRNII